MLKLFLENYQPALKDLNKAIELNSEDASYYKLRGNIHYQLEDDLKACEDWERAKNMGDSSVNYYLRQYCE